MEGLEVITNPVTYEQIELLTHHAETIIQAFKYSFVLVGIIAGLLVINMFAGVWGKNAR